MDSAALVRQTHYARHPYSPKAHTFTFSVGEGYVQVTSDMSNYPLVSPTPGILWTPHALRRTFYVSYPGEENPPNYVSIVVRLGANADPGKFLMVALENVQYETLLLYEIRPFVTLAESRDSANAATNTRVFQVPVFGPEFKRQRYNMIVYGECRSIFACHTNNVPRTSFKSRSN